MDLDLPALVGLPVEQAQEQVSAAGFDPRVLVPDSVVTLEYRANRVNLVVDDGVVVDTPTIG